METNFLFKLWIIIKLCLYYVQSKVVRNIIGQLTDKKQETIDNFLILFSYNREKEYFCYHKISIIYESIFQ